MDKPLNENYTRQYTLEYQKEFNEKCAENINAYWQQLGLDAQAHVEKKLVYVPQAAGGKGRQCWSEEIVSSVGNFPCIRKQTLGIL